MLLSVCGDVLSRGSRPPTCALARVSGHDAGGPVGTCWILPAGFKAADVSKANRIPGKARPGLLLRPACVGTPAARRRA